MSSVSSFYVENQIQKNVCYERNNVLVDLYDLEKENCPNIQETFLRETSDDIGSSQRVLDDVRQSRDDLPIDISYMLAVAQH